MNEIELFLKWISDEFGAKLVYTCDKVRTNVTTEEVELMIERFKEWKEQN